MGPSSGEETNGDAAFHGRNARGTKAEMLSVRCLWDSKEGFQLSAVSQGTEPEEKRGLVESLVRKIHSRSKYW